jgi:acyl dehydratase
MTETSPINILDAADPAAWIGREIGTSRWITVDQPMIDTFGRVTLDWDPMHVDPQWCLTHSPFGTTMGFGFLSISLLTAMLNEVQTRPTDEVATFNYGFDRLRLVSPVLVDRRIRGRFSLRDLRSRRPGRYQATYGVEVEIEGEDKPALAADWLVVTDTARPRPTLDAAASTHPVAD